MAIAQTLYHRSFLLGIHRRFVVSVLGFIGESVLYSMFSNVALTLLLVHKGTLLCRCNYSVVSRPYKNSQIPFGKLVMYYGSGVRTSI